MLETITSFFFDNHKLLNLSALLEVSIAIGIAYLSLNRLRFINEIEELFDAFFIEADEIFEDASRRENKTINRDTVLTRVSEMKENALTGKNPKRLSTLYGTKEKRGLDRDFVFTITAINIIILCVACLTNPTIGSLVYIFCFICPLLGIFVPPALYRDGNKIVNYYKNELRQNITHLRDTYRTDIVEQKEVLIHKQYEVVVSSLQNSDKEIITALKALVELADTHNRDIIKNDKRFAKYIILPEIKELLDS